MVSSFLALILVLPAVATASHWTVHDELGDDSFRRTGEDDAQVIRAAGNPADGMENKVTLAGGSPGDGGLFLDTRVVNHYGSSAETGVAFSASAFAPDLFGRDDVLTPGMHHASAYYGHWNDFNDDGVIDDMHDAACGSVACGGDEFIWRGLGSGDGNVVLAFFTIPDYRYNMRGAGNSSTSTFVDNIMLDRTALDRPVQEWIRSRSDIVADGNLLATFQTLTIAGAPPETGAYHRFVLNHPDGLYDVDTYEAVNPELASLFSSTLSTAFATQQDAVADALATVETIDQTLWDAGYGEVYQLITEVAGMLPPPAGLIPNTNDLLVAYGSKEPNTYGDDYEGRALFGGIGGASGPYNSYATYADGFHLFADFIPRLKLCPGAYARVPGTAVETYQMIACATTSYNPVGAQTSAEQSAGALLSITGYIFLWHDKNADTYVGNRCDPQSGEFDAERNTCDAAHTPKSASYSFGGPEFLGACASSDGRGSVATLTPVGGNWPGVVVVRDYVQTTRVVFDQHWEVIVDDQPIELRYEEDCGGGTLILESRDAILFPSGETLIEIRVESSTGVAAFKDAGLGIDITNERVTDVDRLPPAL